MGKSVRIGVENNDMCITAGNERDSSATPTGVSLCYHRTVVYIFGAVNEDFSARRLRDELIKNCG